MLLDTFFWSSIKIRCISSLRDARSINEAKCLNHQINDESFSWCFRSIAATKPQANIEKRDRTFVSTGRNFQASVRGIKTTSVDLDFRDADC
jgi:hypothetical protein